MKKNQTFIIIFMMLFASSVLAGVEVKTLAKAGTEVSLKKGKVPPGGKTQERMSLKPIQSFAQSTWEINCVVTNPAQYPIVMKFGIDVQYWSPERPSAELDGKLLGVLMAEPQASLKPGSSILKFKDIDNKAFPNLTFLNFDTVETITVKCTANLSVT